MCAVMRLMSLAALIVVGLCLAYARRVEPVVPQSSSYDGPATFVSLSANDDEDVSTRWLLICNVDGERLAFPADAGWVRREAGSMRAGQRVTLRYDLPAKGTFGGYAELGPPTLREIAPVDARDAGALALDTGGR